MYRTIILGVFIVFVYSNDFSQASNNNCLISGELFFSNCKKYEGACKNNQANGWGNLYLNNNDVISGLFVENKIQNSFINYYSTSNNSYIFGPNNGTDLTGPCISVDYRNFVKLDVREKSISLGNDLSILPIPEPKFQFNGEFCNQDGINARKNECHLIPNSNNIVFTSSREFNSKGDTKYWISIVNLSENKIVRNFGSFELPLTTNNSPTFIGFNDLNQPIYNYSGHFYLLNINSGVSKILTNLPIEITLEKNFSINALGGTYKDFVGYEKIELLKDSSYIRIYYKKQNEISSIVKYNKNHEFVSSIDIPKVTVFDFAVNPINNQIVLSYRSTDSTYLSLFDPDNLNLTSNIFSKQNTAFDKNPMNYPQFPGKVRFSKTGKYLLYTRDKGTSIFQGENLYYGVEGDIYDFSSNDNIVIANGLGQVIAYDLDKKNIIWNYKINGNYYDSKSFIVDNEYYLIYGRPTEYIGSKPIKGIKLQHYSMPLPIVTQNLYVKKEQITSSLKIIDSNQENPKKNYIENSSSDIKNNSVSLPNKNVKDADGNIYETIRIGDKIWITDNLKTSRYNDGSAIQLVDDYLTWTKLTSPAYCNPTSYYDKGNEGFLYNHYVIENGEVCPQGYKIPSKEVWQEFIDYYHGRTGGYLLGGFWGSYNYYYEDFDDQELRQKKGGQFKSSGFDFRDGTNRSYYFDERSNNQGYSDGFRSEQGVWLKERSTKYSDEKSAYFGFIDWAEGNYGQRLELKEKNVNSGNYIRCYKEYKSENNAAVAIPITDQNGNTYKTIKIGNQIWMAEDLKTIPTDSKLVFSTEDENHYQNSIVYDFFKNNSPIQYYKSQFNDAFQRIDKDVCPQGWHLPDQGEWEMLLDFFTVNDLMSSNGWKIEIREGYYEQKWVSCSNCSYWTEKQRANNPCTVCRNKKGKYVKTGNYITEKTINYNGSNKSGMNILPTPLLEYGSFDSKKDKAIYFVRNHFYDGVRNLIIKDKEFSFQDCESGKVRAHVRCVKD